MIIFGSRGLTSTRETGTFFCPRCNSQQHYSLQQVRRYFTLYFIPLIPMDVAGEYIECAQCAETWSPEVLSYDPAAEQQEFYEDIKRVMVLMAIADGGVDATEISAIRQYYHRVTGDLLDEAQISQEAQMAVGSGADLTSYVRQIADTLTEDGIVIIVQAAFNVASAGGTIAPAKQVQMQQLPAAIGISDDDLKIIIEHFMTEE